MIARNQGLKGDFEQRIGSVSERQALARAVVDPDCRQSGPICGWPPMAVFHAVARAIGGWGEGACLDTGSLLPSPPLAITKQKTAHCGGCAAYGCGEARDFNDLHSPSGPSGRVGRVAAGEGSPSPSLRLDPPAHAGGCKVLSAHDLKAARPPRGRGDNSQPKTRVKTRPFAEGQ